MDKYNSIKLGFSGSMGQMNSSIINLASKDNSFTITSLYEPYKKVTENDFVYINNTKISHSNDINVLENSDIILDFSHNSNTYNVLNFCYQKNKKIVIGTTKLSNETLNLINKFSEKIAIFYSPNMSFGINAFFSMLPQLVDKFSDFDIEIIEAHHRRKKDAPSGTALKIFEILKSKNNNLEAIYNRNNLDRPREKNEIGICSIRGGGIYGNHSVFFISESEEVEFTHRLINKDALAKGTLIAVKFLISKNKGLYYYEDLIKELKS